MTTSATWFQATLGTLAFVVALGLADARAAEPEPAGFNVDLENIDKGYSAAENLESDFQIDMAMGVFADFDLLRVLTEPPRQRPFDGGLPPFKQQPSQAQEPLPPLP